MHYCEIDPDCDVNGNLAERRDCGHWACDGCTDEETNLCLSCVPVNDPEYAEAVQRRAEFLDGLADRPSWYEGDVDDRVALSEYENRCRLNEERVND